MLPHIKIFRASLIFITSFLLSTAITCAYAENSKVPIGVIAPLTGKMAVIGSALKNGIELARSDRPELFKNIEFIYEDDQFDPKQSLTAYQKLRDINHAPVIFGFGDTLGLVLGPLADRDGVTLMNFNFEATPAIGRKFVVRSMNHTSQYMQALADHLMTQGNSKYIIVQAESPFFNAMANSFRNAVGSNSAVEMLPSYNPNDTDFKASILKIKSAPKAPVGIFLAPDQILNFLKQAKELRLEREYFGTDLFETSAGITSDPATLQGCLYPDNEASAPFRDSYRLKYRNESQLTFAASAYEMALLFGEILSSGESADSHNLVKAVSGVRDREGVLGKYSFVEDEKFGKFFQFPVYIKNIVERVGVPVS